MTTMQRTSRVEARSWPKAESVELYIAADMLLPYGDNPKPRLAGRHGGQGGGGECRAGGSEGRTDLAAAGCYRLDASEREEGIEIFFTQCGLRPLWDVS